MVHFLSWNVRELNAPNKQKEVKLLCNEEKVGLIGLLETKIKKDKMDQLADKILVVGTTLKTWTLTIMGGFGSLGGLITIE